MSPANSRSPVPPQSPELVSIGRIRTLATWMRRTSKPAKDYPKIRQLSSREVFDAQQFACGRYPWPKRWTVKLFHVARDG